jgi:hypothetical protein
MLFETTEIYGTHVESDEGLLSNTLDSVKFPVTSSKLSTSAILGGIISSVFVAVFCDLYTHNVNTPLGGLCVQRTQHREYHGNVISTEISVIIQIEYKY